MEYLNQGPTHNEEYHARFKPMTIEEYAAFHQIGVIANDTDETPRTINMHSRPGGLRSCFVASLHSGLAGRHTDTHFVAHARLPLKTVFGAAAPPWGPTPGSAGLLWQVPPPPPSQQRPAAKDYQKSTSPAQDYTKNHLPSPRLTKRRFPAQD